MSENGEPSEASGAVESVSPSEGGGGGETFSGSTDTGGSTQMKKFTVIFHGKTMDYFRIWIVNMLLSILTLGIYSAWAKVRTYKYFAKSTELSGARFDFHGDPIAILIGRLIMVGLLMIYTTGSRLHIFVAIFGMILLAAGFPWLFIKSLKFKTKYTSYRNIAFSFRGKIDEGYRIWFKYLWPYILLFGAQMFASSMIVTNSEGKAVGPQSAMYSYIILGIGLLMLVYVLYMIHRFVAEVFRFIYNNIYYGGQKFSMSISYKEVYKEVHGKLNKYLGLSLVAFIGLAYLGGIITSAVSKGLGGAIIVLGAIVFYFVMISVSVCVPLWINRLVWRRIKIEQWYTTETYNTKEYLKIALLNFIAVAFSLGFLYPWAKIRMQKYMLEGRSLNIDGFDQFVTEASSKESAIGHEVAEGFDIDIEVGL